MNAKKRGFPNHVSHERHTLLDQTNSYKRACYKTPLDSNIQAPLWKSILLPAEFSFRFLKSISIRVPIGWHMVDTDVCVYVTTLKLIRGPRTERESLFNPFDSIYHKLLLKLSIADTLGKGTKKKMKKKKGRTRDEVGARDTYVLGATHTVIVFFRQWLHHTFRPSHFFASLSPLLSEDRSNKGTNQ